MTINQLGLASWFGVNKNSQLIKNYRKIRILPNNWGYDKENIH
jgi:hypothetical protein